MSPRRDPKRLDRLLRVRSLQLDLARAEQAAAAERASSAAALAARIDSLHQDVAPQPGLERGLDLFAAAHYRDRLAASQIEARRRMAVADRQLDQAREAAGVAKRDHGAIEKLVERALDSEAAAARKAMEEAPHPARALARSLLRQG